MSETRIIGGMSETRGAITEIRIIDGMIELDGRPVAQLLPNVRLSQLDRLNEIFDSLDEGYLSSLEEYIEYLKGTVALLGLKEKGKAALQ